MRLKIGELSFRMNVGSQAFMFATRSDSRPDLGKRRGSFFFALLSTVLLALPRLATADITVTATVNAKQVRVGEAITLAVEINGAQNVAAPSIRVDGLDARYVGPSTQVSIVNGHMSSSIQHRYSLLALQAGRFEIGPITINYDGKDYTTPPIGLEVIAANAPAANAGGGNPGASGGQGKALYLVVSTPKTEVYLHQRILIDVDLYILSTVRAGDLQFPTLSSDGLSLEAFPQPTQRQQVIDGQTYQVVHFQTSASAVRSGPLNIGPASIHLTVYERSRRNGASDPFFDNFFQQGRATDVRSEPLAINVLPLPAGKPKDFSGAVGSFSMAVKAAPTKLNAGDPITVKMTISGEGNLADANPPVLSNPDGFRAYDARAANSDANGREYEQVLIPNADTVRAIPPFRFSYFDPQSGRYNTLQSDPIALEVAAPQQAPHTDIVSAEPRKRATVAEEKLGRDIVFIKEDPGTLTATKGSQHGERWALAWLPIPPLLLGIVVWFDRRRRRLSGDETYARFTRAGKEARLGLDAAAQALQKGERAAFYEAVSKTLREYLAAKLGVPVGAADAEAAAARGVSAECVELLRKILATCEFVRFSPTTGEADMRSILDSAQDIVKRIERERRAFPLSSTATRLVAFLFVPLLLITGNAGAADSDAANPQSLFYHANSLYKDGRYRDAAEEYEKVLGLGLQSSNLHFNIGNSWFKVGDRGRAIVAYERALRLSPSDPDIEANLGFARSLNNVEPCIPPLWASFAFPLAGRLSTSTLISVSLLAYTLLFLLLIAQRMLSLPPRWLSRTAAASGVLTILVGASTLYQVYADTWETRAVVTAEGDTNARFEPADNGTAHYTLKQGAVVEILEKRDSWIQVSRCDGRRGWIPRRSAVDL